MNEGRVQLTDYEAVLEVVHQWPLSRRFALVQDVLDAMSREFSQSRPRTKTLEKALGLLATEETPPTDADVRRWLHEHRIEKYG